MSFLHSAIVPGQQPPVRKSSMQIGRVTTISGSDSVLADIDGKAQIISLDDFISGLNLASDAGGFATTAQGDLADGALQRTGGEMSGDITFDLGGVHRVDGRDVSADGAKLDGIEAGADVTDAANVAAAGAHMSGGTDIPVTDGGTGVSSLTDGGVLLGSGTGAITTMGVLADGEIIVGDGTTDPVAESGATARTSLGLGTGDTPQFTGVNFGDEDLTAYDEGTWTPTLGFTIPGDENIILSFNFGSYSRIGDLVTVVFALVTSTFTHTTASGMIEIGGLPFASANVSGQNSRQGLVWAGITKSSYTQIVTIIPSNVSVIRFQASGSGVANSDVFAADMPTSGSVLLAGSLTYKV